MAFRNKHFTKRPEGGAATNKITNRYLLPNTTEMLDILQCGGDVLWTWIQNLALIPTTTQATSDLKELSATLSIHYFECLTPGQKLGKKWTD